MSKPKGKASAAKPEPLFDRIVTILDQARGNVVRAVNTNMVLAYWLIGREIVEELQRGKGRAKYGEEVIDQLSKRLMERYGQGFSEANLQNFRKFYLAYQERIAIPYPMGRESGGTGIPHPLGVESGTAKVISSPLGRESASAQKSYPLGSELPRGFSPQLSWSHYRALMRVENREARDFYEREAVAGGWDKRTLERQIQSFYYERILKSRKPQKMLTEGRNLPVPVLPAADELKNPYVLEFLGLPDVTAFHESDLEGRSLRICSASCWSSATAFPLSPGRSLCASRSRTGTLTWFSITAA